MKKNLLYFEILTAVIAVATVFWKSDLGIAAVVILLGGALLYYLLSMAQKKNFDAKRHPILRFMTALSFLSLSILAVGIVFTIQHYPGARMMVFVSMVSGVPAFIYYVIRILKHRDEEVSLSEDSEELEEKPNFLSRFKKIKYSDLEMAVRMGLAALLQIKYMFLTNNISVIVSGS